MFHLLPTWSAVSLYLDQSHHYHLTMWPSACPRNERLPSQRRFWCRWCLLVNLFVGVVDRLVLEPGGAVGEVSYVTWRSPTSSPWQHNVFQIKYNKCNLDRLDHFCLCDEVASRSSSTPSSGPAQRKTDHIARLQPIVTLATFKWQLQQLLKTRLMLDLVSLI